MNAWFVHRTLWTRFQVGKSDLLVSYRADGRRMIVTFVTTTAEPQRVGGGGEDCRAPEIVRSFAVLSVQRAVLYKQD